jgi:hypothetical protein
MEDYDPHQQTRAMRPLHRLLTVVAAISLALAGAIIIAPTASASTCWSGVAYRDAWTDHNYVEFRVNASANSWHLEKSWWAFFPAQLWAYPDRNGLAKAGINGTDLDPPYAASGYRLCTGPGPTTV